MDEQQVWVRVVCAVREGCKIRGHFGREFEEKKTLNICAVVKGTTYLDIQVNSFAVF
jgi:hypothetical protein